MSLQVLFKGLYQLSRLHYCFANDQIHSNKGYPKWLFIMMITAGIVLSISYVISVLLLYPYSILSTCGITKELEYYAASFQFISIGDGFIKRAIIIAVGVLFVTWDITTLYLYIYKIHLFRSELKSKHGDNVYKRIILILHKIVILTIFYQLIGLIVLIIAFITTTVNLSGVSLSIVETVRSLSITIAIYLMMDHNEDEYIKFLKIVHCLRFHAICCKYRNMVIDQLDELDMIDIEINSGNNIPTNELTTIDTRIRDISCPIPITMDHNRTHSS